MVDVAEIQLPGVDRFPVRTEARRFGQRQRQGWIVVRQDANRVTRQICEARGR